MADTPSFRPERVLTKFNPLREDNIIGRPRFSQSKLIAISARLVK